MDVVNNLYSSAASMGGKVSGSDFATKYAEDFANRISAKAARKGANITQKDIEITQKFSGYNMSKKQRGAYGALAALKNSDPALYREFLRESGLRVSRNKKGQVMGSRSMEDIARSVAKYDPTTGLFEFNSGKDIYYINPGKIRYEYKKNGSPVIIQEPAQWARHTERDSDGNLVWHAAAAPHKPERHYKTKTI